MKKALIKEDKIIWLARNKIRKEVFLYEDKPIKDEKHGIWKPANAFSKYDKLPYPEEYTDIKWEDSEPKEMTLNEFAANYN